MLRIITLCIIFLAATSTGTFSQIPTFTLSYGEPNQVTVNAVPPPPSGRSAITFSGDLMLARRVETMLDAYGSSFVYARLPSYASSTDWFVANFEASVPKRHIHTPDLTFRFSVDAAHLGALQRFGVTHVGLANNHSFDAGEKGYEESLVALREAGLTPFGGTTIGSSTVSLLHTNDTTVAVFALYAVDETPDLAALARLMVAYASTTYQIAYVHWGSEYLGQHRATTEHLATELVALGFDAIIGHHPHVVQDIGYIEGVPVFYSLGNFIFDQYFSLDVQVGLLLRLTPSPEALRFELQPITSLDSRSQPRFMTDAEKALFLATLADKSDPEYRDTITAGFIVSSSTKVANSQ